MAAFAWINGENHSLRNSMECFVKLVLVGGQARLKQRILGLLRLVPAKTTAYKHTRKPCQAQAPGFSGRRKLSSACLLSRSLASPCAFLLSHSFPYVTRIECLRISAQTEDQQRSMDPPGLQQQIRADETSSLVS